MGPTIETFGYNQASQKAQTLLQRFLIPNLIGFFYFTEQVGKNIVYGKTHQIREKLRTSLAIATLKKHRTNPNKSQKPLCCSLNNSQAHILR